MSTATASGSTAWAMKLFRVSVLKQQKWRMIASTLGPTANLSCLDIGSDNGVISHLLRVQGGAWTSADLDERTVETIRSLVGEPVVLLDPKRAPFGDGAFDRVVLVDCLEHVQDDKRFVQEMVRITKPGGEIIFNVPNKKNSLLRRFRLAVGQTDEAHGHLRHGYTEADLAGLFPKQLQLVSAKTYSRFFSESVDTLMTWAIRTVKREKHGGGGAKGTVVTGRDLSKHKSLLTAYTLLYPFLWLVAQADKILWFRSGYMLMAKARVCPEPGARA